MNEIVIEKLMASSAEAAADLARLVPQMTTNQTELITFERLGEILQSGAQLFVARDGRRIVGVVVLSSVEILVGSKFWIDDVIVDREYQGRGVATSLMKALLEAVPEDAYSVNLTSNPSRSEARAWYGRLGFVPKSEVFRLQRD
jgi:ribosomal protein S18 acetylase RimI-like enzyme